LRIGNLLGRDSLKALLPPLPSPKLEWSHTPTLLLDMARIRKDSYEIQHVVFKSKLETKDYGRLGALTPHSDDDVAVAVPPQALERLNAGDLCEVLFPQDSGSVAEGGVARLLSVDGFPVDFSASFLNLLWKAGSVEGGDVHSSLQLPTPVLEEIPTEK